jgi:hypothetical protein
MTKIDEDMEKIKCFPLCEVECKVRASRPIRALNYQYLASCVYSCCVIVLCESGASFLCVHYRLL